MARQFGDYRSRRGVPTAGHGGHCTCAEHRDHHPRHHPVRVAGRPPEQHRDPLPQLPLRRAGPRLRLQGVRAGRSGGRRSPGSAAWVSAAPGCRCRSRRPASRSRRAGRLGGGDRFGEHDRQRRRAAARLQHRLPRGAQAPGRARGSAGAGVRRAGQRGHGQGGRRGAARRRLHRGTVVARNAAGAALAEQYGFDAGGEVAPPSRYGCWSTPRPIGMAGRAAADDLPFAREVVEQAEAVFDVVAFPPETPLVRLARGARGSTSSPAPRSSPCRPPSSSSSTPAYGPPGPGPAGLGVLPRPELEVQAASIGGRRRCARDASPQQSIDPRPAGNPAQVKVGDQTAR